jgi:hypothetical protein
MQNERKIHLVPRPELAVRLEECAQAPAKPPSKRHAVDAKDIVRETLVIARECRGVLASNPMTKDRLIVDLVASLAVARLKKRGQL